MESLSSEMLLQAYLAAKELDVDEAFLDLLEKEMDRRQIKIASDTAR
ncbi:sporulation histidine kinase inhibitor Sda [Thalassobacillus pellis]|nr:sporulation histidine kinase inhibitor Sda [Thalassobacillus pellis]MBM7551942.1 hypothetical protein [Thalassobacillus pellis]